MMDTLLAVLVQSEVDMIWMRDRPQLTIMGASHLGGLMMNTSHALALLITVGLEDHHRVSKSPIVSFT